MSDEAASFDWDSDSEAASFDKDRHVRFLLMMFDLLPSHYQSQEINRITLAYFAVVGLDILGSLDKIDKLGAIEWVLSLQVHPRNEDELNNGQFYGFHGSRSSQFQSVDEGVLVPNGSHLASTYCALAILRTLDYDLSLLNSSTILRSLKNLQQSDGSFMPIHSGAEKPDLRFVFCAVAICFMLHGWSGMDREKAKEYIITCQSYDGGFGLVPGSESHVPLYTRGREYYVVKMVMDGFFSMIGGATYCAVSSLHLMGFMEENVVSDHISPCIIDVPMLLDWCLQRQADDGGFQGRPNKDSDTCYAFWVGGILKILGGYRFTDEKNLHKFLLSCQTKYGGFSKFPGQLPDLYHSYYGICAVSLLEEPVLKSVNVMLGMTDMAACGLALFCN